MIGRKRSVLITLLVTLVAARTADAATYQVIDLGKLGAGAMTIANAINDNGQVVGTSGNLAFIWQNGVMSAIDLPEVYGGRNETPVDINNSGQVICRQGTWWSSYGYVWQNGSSVLLPSYGGEGSEGVAAAPYAIDESGKVYGSADLRGYTHAVTWSGNYSSFVDYGSGGFIRANDGGDAIHSRQVSMYESETNLAHPLAADPPEVNVLVSFGTNEQPTDVNNAEHVLGYKSVDGVRRAFLWANGSMDLFGSEGALPYAMNDQDHVVGSLGSNATLWQNGNEIDLNGLISSDSGWHLYGAADINNHGWIVGYGMFNDSDTYHAYLMKPDSVPEPTSLVLLSGLGVMGLIAARRRKRTA